MQQALQLKDAYRLFHLGTLALARAERQGIRVDVEYLHKQKRKLQKQVEQLEEEFKDTKFYRDWKKAQGTKPVNINSNAQLSDYLYNHLKIEVTKHTKTGKGSTDEEALESLNVKGVDYILQIRKLNKIKDTYIESFLRETVNGYMHPFFQLHTVSSYRSSSSDPNFQNIPARDETARRVLRRALYPRPGHQLLEIDYGQLEVRVAACYNKDQTLIDYINDPATDMHRDMANQIYGLGGVQVDNAAFKVLRGSAKNGFVFPQFYGDYYKNNAYNLIKWVKLGDRLWKPGQGIEIIEGHTISDHLREQGIRSFNAFVDHLEEVEHHFWTKRFYEYDLWKDRVWGQYQDQGYFDTLTGFRLQGLMSKNQLVNEPIQGSAFHCLLWSFIELDRLMIKEKWQTRLIGQIHDSILLDVYPPEMDYVMQSVKRVTCEDLLKKWRWIIVPFSIEAELCGVDEPWYNKKQVEI